MLLFIDMLERVGFLIAIAFVLSRSRWLGSYLVYQGERKNKLIFIAFFSFFAIVGTYSGLQVSHFSFEAAPLTGLHVPDAAAIANSRTVGVVIAGLLGGVGSGLIVGIIAGIHRYSLGGFVAFACMVAPILQGLLAGMARNAIKKRYRKPSSVWLALGIGFLAEVLQMLLILLLAKPLSASEDLVSLIGIPQTLTNSIGVAMFFMLHIQVQNEVERIGAVHASKALQIADMTLPHWNLPFKQAIQGIAQILINEINHTVGVYFIRHNLPTVGEGRHTAYSIDIPLNRDQNQPIGVFRLYFNRPQDIHPSRQQQQEALSQLLSQQYAFAESKKQAQLLADAEIRSLQAQMNPHFLFNVLNTVISFIRTKPNEARQMIIDLASFLRRNMQNSSKPLVTIADEMELVRSYLQLTKARKGSQLEIHMDTDESIMDKLLPPFTIQPLVENAIVHGIKNLNRPGIILVSAKQQDDYAVITVQDNGVGMQMDETQGEEPNHMGIALNNIEQRLKYHFGTEKVLHIESHVMQGTTITFIVR